MNTKAQDSDLTITTRTQDYNTNTKHNYKKVKGQIDRPHEGIMLRTQEW